jgi:flagellar basal-body rod protein FlgG
MRALSIAATGMAAQQSSVEVIANNIANVNTSGFKRGRAEFSDLLYQTDRPAGTPGAQADGGVPEGTSFGLGVRTVGVRHLHTQGTFTRTGNSLDLALNGAGYFQLTGPNGETVYTRAGTFSRNAQGQIVNPDGHALSPVIAVPQNTTDVVVNDAGQVFARDAGTGQLQGVGQLVIARFANTGGLEPLGGNLYRETAASGAPTTSAPQENGAASVQQGYTEASNVDSVKEITELIAAQRAYEMNSKVVQAADDMYGVVSKGLR